MDPFVVISFGKKVFRTRVIRHSLNPVWDEKLLFHVRRYETSFQVMLTVLDWDKLSSNDYVGDARFDVAELVKDAPQPDSRTGLYDMDEDGSHPMKEFSLPLVTAKEAAWEAKHTPVLHVRYVCAGCGRDRRIYDVPCAVPNSSPTMHSASGSGRSTSDSTTSTTQTRSRV